MTWTPSPADEVPNPAGINSLRKMFGFNLSSKGAASNKKKSTQSKGEQTGQQGQEQELQQQEFKEEHAEEGEERAEAESSGLSVERQGDLLPAARAQVSGSETLWWCCCLRAIPVRVLGWGGRGGGFAPRPPTRRRLSAGCVEPLS